MRTIRIFAFILIAAFMARCETIVEVDLPEHTPLLVANCVFSPENDWVVRVNHSSGILETDAIRPLENARVNIVRSDGQSFLLSQQSDGYYYDPTVPAPQSGVTYQLQVDAPGYTAIEAESVVPVAVEIDSVTARQLRTITGDNQIELTVYFQDPPEMDNYYQLAVYQRFEGHRFVDYLDFDSDDLILNNSSDGSFSDDLIDGKSYAIKVRIDMWELSGGNVGVDLISGSEAFYHYLTTYYSFEETDENPFAEPVFVYNNIENGFGIFAGYNTFRYELEGVGAGNR